MGLRVKVRSFVETMIHLARENKSIRVVNDQVLTPTHTRDLVEKIKGLIQTETCGLYYITNSGQYSWYEFATKIFELLDFNPDFGPKTSVEYGTKNTPAGYSVLAHERLRQLGLDS